MHLDAFIGWLNEHGAVHDGVEMRECGPDSCERGVFATRNFRDNELILSVPDRLIISAGCVAEMPKQRAILEQCALKPFEALVLFFATEDACASSWSAYLAMLPDQFCTPSVCYPELKCEALPFDLQKNWQNQTAEIHALFTKLLNVIPQLAWHRYLWAWNLVNTRCIYRKNAPHHLIDNADGDTTAVVPLIDMLNHSNENQCCALSESRSQRYSVIALRSISAGDQICICYGAHANGCLWMDYGFRIHNNICNKVEITIDEFLDYAKSVGLRFPDNRRDVIVQAGFPCVIYASDCEPNFALKVNLAFLLMDSDLVKRWPELIYSESEKIGSKDFAQLLSAFRDKLLRGRSAAPEACQWLWSEEIALVENVLHCDNKCASF